MVHTVEVKQARAAYLNWLTELEDNGDDIEVKGRKTKEILDAATTVTEPWHHCILLPSRRWNPWLALSEALWILAGRNDIETLLPYNQRIKQFSDDGKTLYGAYGTRIYSQIDDMIERLRKDPNDRRAVLQIWDGFSKYGRPAGNPYPEDLTTISKDPPCNNLVYFKLRHNKLHMTVICRSNDLHWGLFAVNLPTFSILQSYIASRLGVDIGTQTHLSNSLHIYKDGPAEVITQRMLYEETEDMPAYPEHSDKLFGDLTDVQSHKEFAAFCNDVLEGGSYQGGKYPTFLNFANEFLFQYRNHIWKPNLLYGPYNDWKLAGNIFLERTGREIRN